MKFAVWSCKNVLLSALTVIGIVWSGAFVKAAEIDAGGGSYMVSSEYMACVRERVKLLSDRLKNTEGEYLVASLPAEVVWKQRVELDIAKLLLLRLEAKKLPTPGLAEVVLQLKYAELFAELMESNYEVGDLKVLGILDVRLMTNQVKLNYLNLLPMVKDKSALDKAIADLKTYPKTPVTDAELKALLAAE